MNKAVLVHYKPKTCKPSKIIAVLDDSVNELDWINNWLEKLNRKPEHEMFAAPWRYDEVPEMIDVTEVKDDNKLGICTRYIVKPKDATPVVKR